ncbi:molybdopterin-dependent oxidoreductase [Streptomyces bungoensis]|uniref:molybdopterin-dependent oxidoreductase n=1 Tax=Streptomyces bungoensis TaxID=285568 RepID=UPI0033FA0C57
MRDRLRLPSSPGFWRSPLRGPWFTSVLGLVLLAGITVLFVTGLVSYAAYNPGLSPVNDKTPDKGLLGFYLFAWPTGPVWLYRFTQGVHVTLGITLIPVLLAKLWSVVPRLFTLPPARSLTHALERLSLLLLVGGGLFEFTTGVLNVQLDYVFPGSFYPLHFYGAWVFFAAFLAHAALKTPTAVRAVRRRSRGEGHMDGAESTTAEPAAGAAPHPGSAQGARAAEGTGAADVGRSAGAASGPGAAEGLRAAADGAAGEGRTGAASGPEVAKGARAAEGAGVAQSAGAAAGAGSARAAEGVAGAGPGQSDLVSPCPAEPTVSRRGALALVGGGSLLLFVTTVGQSLGGAWRRTALLAPHGGADPGGGPNGFQINKTAAYAGITPADRHEDAWRLVVTGRTGTVRLSRAQLLALPLHSSALPIACVEGWSTADQWWRGVRLRDLAALVGHDGDPPDVLVESLQRHGAFRRAALRANQVADPRSLLALHVNGEELSPDHGHPARIIVPAAPGVLNTKWVARLTFGDL